MEICYCGHPKPHHPVGRCLAKCFCGCGTPCACKQYCYSHTLGGPPVQSAPGPAVAMMTGRELFEIHEPVGYRTLAQGAGYRLTWKLLTADYQKYWNEFADALSLPANKPDADPRDLAEAVLDAPKLVRQRIYRLLYNAGHRVNK